MTSNGCVASLPLFQIKSHSRAKSRVGEAESRERHREALKCPLRVKHLDILARTQRMEPQLEENAAASKLIQTNYDHTHPAFHFLPPEPPPSSKREQEARPCFCAGALKRM